MEDEELFDGGVYYVNFPNYSNKVRGGFGSGAIGQAVDKTIDSVGLGDSTVPLGHAGIVTVDKNGNTRYYEYGRYPNANVGVKIQGKGNWNRSSIPNVRVTRGKADHQALANALANKYRQNVELVYVHDADPSKATTLINEVANNPNRPEYGLVFGPNCGAEAERIIEGSSPSHGWFSDFWWNTVPRGLMPNTKAGSFSRQGYSTYTGSYKHKHGGVINYINIF